jgi:hypothetical protein
MSKGHAHNEPHLSAGHAFNTGAARSPRAIQLIIKLPWFRYICAAPLQIARPNGDNGCVTSRKKAEGSVNTVATTAGSTSDVPVLRITPPSRWWVLPVGELWDYRELLYFFVWRDIKVRYKQTAIGIAWVVLQPLLTMAVFTLFFGRLAKLPSEGLPYPIFYFAALVPWTYFSGALQHATNIMVENQQVITKVYFPRLILPMSAVVYLRRSGHASILTQ